MGYNISILIRNDHCLELIFLISVVFTNIVCIYVYRLRDEVGIKRQSMRNYRTEFGISFFLNMFDKFDGFSGL